MFLFLAVLTISSTAGLQTWRTLFDNFAIRVAGLDGSHVGVIQSVREIPGFLAVLVVYVLLIMKEHHLSALSVLCLGVGVAVTGFFPTWMGIALTTVLMSFGFHYYETTNQSLTLQYFGSGESPWVFGKLRSLAAATNIGVGIFIYITMSFFSYTQMYAITGITIMAVSLWGFMQNPSNEDLVPQKKKMVLFSIAIWFIHVILLMKRLKSPEVF